MLALTTGIHSAFAATYTWTGTGFFGQDYLWSNDFNWAGNVAPSAGETNVTLVFLNDASPRIMTNDISGLTVSSMVFFGSNYVIHGKPSGNPLTLKANSGLDWAIAASLNGNQIAGDCPISLGSTGTVAVSSGSTFTISSLIYGSGGLVKSSPGTLKLNSGVANLFTGGTTVLDGVLALANAVNAIPGQLNIGRTNAVYSPIVRLLADNQIADSAPVFLGVNGQLQLNTFDDKMGPITMTNGTSVSTGSLGGPSSPGLLTLNGSVTNSGPLIGPPALLVGRFDLGGATRIFHSENIIQVNAVISGTGGVILTGPQDVIFYGANTYSGQTLIENGELALGLAGTPGSTASGTTVQPGGAIRVHDVNIGNESLTLHGGAPRSMVYLGTNTWNGPVSVIDECVIVNDKPGSINDLPDLTFAGAVTGTGALRKQGIGTLRFSGAVGNTYSGGFYCQEGTAYFNKSSSAPALSGPLVIGGPSALTTASVIIQKINQIPNTVPISLLEHGTLRTENSATDSLGPIEFTGGALFGASGSFTLSGDVTNHFTSFGPGGIYGNVSVSGARIFHCDDGSVLNVQSALGGVGGVLKMGPGEMTLAGPCTYSQGTIVEEGILHVQGNGRPGDGSAATSVLSGALLHLDGVNLTNQNFYLEGGAANNAPALLYSDTNYLTGGSVEIHKAVTFKADPAAKLTVDTAITGSEGLRHEGDGTLALSGAQPNTYSGATLFGQGRLLLAHNNNASVPHSLVVGYETNGSPSAVVQCSAPNQFALLGGSELGLGGVTLNAGTSLDCGGYNQSIANLNLTDASVATGGGHLALMGNLLVQPGASGQSFLSGTIQLNTGINNTHLFSVASNVVVFSSANFTESGTQNIYKDGAGQFGSLGSMVFSGTLTVHNGRWLAANANPFGTPAAPTIVDAGATLVAFAGTFSEPLQLAGDGDNGAGALYTTSTNSFDGSVVLTDDTTITADSSAILELKGAVSGPGKLTKEGTGTLLLSGPAANTYAGGTLVSQGVLELGKSGAVAVPGDLTCPGNSGNNGVRLLAPDQIADAAAVALQGSAFLNLNDNNETIGSLSGSGPVALGSGTLTAGANGKDTSFSGGMGGTGGLTKTGTGTMTLHGNKLHKGTTIVDGGKLIVNGQQEQSPVSINNGAILGGTGRVGNIANLDGIVSPGAVPGILTCSNFATFSPANQLQIEINGSTPGTGYDQLQVNGTVVLMGGVLQVSMNTPGAISNEYVIVNNDDVDAVTGSFTGLPEGSSITNKGVSFTLTYHGGDGNDISLIQQTLTPQAHIISGLKLPNGRFALTGLGAANVSYAIEASTNLVPPVVWTQIGTAVANDAGNITFSDVGAPQYPERFYRLRNP